MAQPLGDYGPCQDCDDEKWGSTQPIDYGLDLLVHRPKVLHEAIKDARN
jgi:hypothetical protein